MGYRIIDHNKQNLRWVLKYVLSSGLGDCFHWYRRSLTEYVL